MKVKFKIKFIIALLALFYDVDKAFGQGPQFSQYYNLLQYHNPAFTGSSYALRGVLLSRIQWPGLESRYITSVASLDYNLAKYNSGIGMTFINDLQGENSIKTNKLNFLYSYHLHLNSNWSVRGGLNLGMSRRSLNNGSLYYPDQFNGSGFQESGQEVKLAKNYIDITSGVAFFNKRFWSGVSLAHLNQPNHSFIGQIEKIPIRIDAMIGYKIILKSNPTMRYIDHEDEEVWSLFPTVLYKLQGQSDQLDLGVHTIYKITNLGIWYRGIPIKNYATDRINNEALVVLLGLKIENFAFHYSYDFVISPLRTYAQGAHEISLTILYPKRKKFNLRYKNKRIPCPDFYNCRVKPS